MPSSSDEEFVVVALDIETLGLLLPTMAPTECPQITCVCLVITSQQEEERDLCLRMWKVSPEELAHRTRLIVQALDGADRIVGYNALQFDLECLRRSLRIAPEQHLRWLLKTVDPLVPARALADGGCTMLRMLELNGFTQRKLADGLEAVRMAEADQWDDLLRYCLEDARLVLRLVREREWLRLSPFIECRNLLGRGGGVPEFRRSVRVCA